MSSAATASPTISRTDTGTTDHVGHSAGQLDLPAREMDARVPASAAQGDTVRSVVLATDIQMLIGAWTPVVLAIGFCAILLLRRRDRRRGDSDDDPSS